MLERIRTAVLWGRHHADVRVGVIDVGSNTVRLLVAEHGRTVLTDREMLRLGADIERHGSVPADKLDLVADVVAGYAAEAREAGVAALEVLIASPGRQAANGADLLGRLEEAAGFPARVLSAVEEGHLAFVGALANANVPARRTVAVVDVGGGSAQVVVGSRQAGPQWARSIDLGSQRLTSRLLAGDPPGAAAVGAARAEVERYLDGFDPPTPRVALAVGGSARAVKRLVGPRLGPDELREALKIVAKAPAAELVERYDVSVPRAPTLAAGAVILAELQGRLQVPLKVVRGGLREGAIAALAAEHAVRAA